MSEKISKILAVSEHLKVLNNQAKLIIIFLLVLIVCFILGNIFTRLISGVSIIIFLKVFLNNKKEIDRLRESYDTE